MNDKTQQASNTSIHHYVLNLSYDGTDFSGFAKQKDPKVTTVQDTVEQALKTCLRLPAVPETVCAGRTDAGVHALDQHLSFALNAATAADIPLPLDGRQRKQIVRSLNALTSDSVSIRSLVPTTASFSARFDALSREYRYYIYNATTPPAFIRDFSWHVPQSLDLEAMILATNYLRGKHDFRSFCTKASAEPEKNTVREILEIEIFPQEIMGEELLTIRIVGTAFLHSMVRIIVGTLHEIGHSKRNPEDILHILAAQQREAAGQTAPAKGLILHKVNYPSAAFCVK